jgi:hypothetical protein
MYLVRTEAVDLILTLMDFSPCFLADFMPGLVALGVEGNRS